MPGWSRKNRLFDKYPHIQNCAVVIFLNFLYISFDPQMFSWKTLDLPDLFQACRKVWSYEENDRILHHAQAPSKRKKKLPLVVYTQLSWREFWNAKFKLHFNTKRSAGATLAGCSSTYHLRHGRSEAAARCFRGIDVSVVFMTTHKLSTRRIEKEVRCCRDSWFNPA